MEHAYATRWTTGSRGGRLVLVAAAELLVKVGLAAVVDPNSIATLVWGTDLPAFPATP